LNECGEALASIIDKKLSIYYGECVIKGLQEAKNKIPFSDPVMIVEASGEDETQLANIGNFKKMDDINNLKQLRLDLPKTNPEQGSQSAIFEGYGFSGDNLPLLGDKLEKLDELVVNAGLKAFLRYGHGPSVWFTGRNTRNAGLIMHAREITPDMSGQELYRFISDIITFCKEENITPKPEHKYPYTDEEKLKRLGEIRKLLGNNFNPFIFSGKPEQMEKLVI